MARDIKLTTKVLSPYIHSMKGQQGNENQKKEGRRNLISRDELRNVMPTPVHSEQHNDIFLVSFRFRNTHSFVCGTVNKKSESYLYGCSVLLYALKWNIHKKWNKNTKQFVHYQGKRNIFCSFKIFGHAFFSSNRLLCYLQLGVSKHPNFFIKIRKQMFALFS